MVTPDDVLNQWRKNVTGITQAELGRRMNVGEPAVSAWMTRKTYRQRLTDRAGDWKPGTAPPLNVEYDEALEAEDRIVTQLMWAAATEQVLPPTVKWDHNYPSWARRPWIWIRAEEGPIQAVVRHGVFETEYRGAIGKWGVFITFRAAVNHPPVRVKLDRPGWVDFGRGPVSSEFGADIFDAMSHLRPTESARYATFALGQRLLRNLSVRDRRLIGQRMMLSEVSIDAIMNAPSPTESSRPSQVAAPVHEVDDVDPAPYRTARRHRLNIAQDKVGALLGQLGYANPAPAGDLISRFEGHGFSAGGVSAKHALLPAALDMIYGGGGRLAPVPFAPPLERGRGQVTFPSWWKGPVTFHATERTTLTLTWGHYRKTVELAPGGAVWTGCANASKPVQVRTAPAAFVRLYLGELPGALDINDNWEAKSRFADIDIGKEFAANMRRAFSTTSPLDWVIDRLGREPGRGRRGR